MLHDQVRRYEFYKALANASNEISCGQLVRGDADKAKRSALILACVQRVRGMFAVNCMHSLSASG